MAIRPRRDRKSAIAVAKVKRPFLETHLQLAALKDTPILVAQDRQKNLVTQIRFEWMPVDIEVGRAPGARPVLEDIHPPLVERLRDPHVIRHKIEYLAHRVR